MADITANLVTPSQLDTWMQGAIGSSLASADQWCYGINAITGVPCPAPDDFGFPLVNGMRVPPSTSSTTFLDALRNYQLGLTSITVIQPGNPGPGVIPQPQPKSTPTPMGQGVLGPTNCKICQQLHQQPVLLLVLAVAIYYLVIK